MSKSFNSINDEIEEWRWTLLETPDVQQQKAIQLKINKLQERRDKLVRADAKKTGNTL